MRERKGERESERERERGGGVTHFILNLLLLMVDAG